MLLFGFLEVLFLLPSGALSTDNNNNISIWLFLLFDIYVCKIHGNMMSIIQNNILSNIKCTNKTNSLSMKYLTFCSYFNHKKYP